MTDCSSRLGTRLGTATLWDGRALAVAPAAHVRGARVRERTRWRNLFHLRFAETKCFSAQDTT
eukprot:3899110-Alexandrium_andersonii.AAC.1